MRIIDNPDTMLPDEVIRRIEPPEATSRVREPSPGRSGRSDDAEAGEGGDAPAEARGSGHGFGPQMPERAQEMAEDAAEDREDFGRSIAGEVRPDDHGPPVELPGPL